MRTGWTLFEDRLEGETGAMRVGSEGRRVGETGT